MAFDEHLIDLVNRLPAVAGRMARPERRPELRALRLLRLSRQRARRLAWRGRSSSANLRAWSLRVRRSAPTRPSGGGAGSATAGRAGDRVSYAEEMDARGIPRVLYAVWAQFGEAFARIEQLKRGTGMPAPPDWHPRHRHGHRTRRCKLHHKATGRDDEQAPHGGFSGPQHTQHGAVEGLRNPRQRIYRPASPSMAKRAATMPLSASLLRSMALAQSTVFPYQNKTGT